MFVLNYLAGQLLCANSTASNVRLSINSFQARKSAICNCTGMGQAHCNCCISYDSNLHLEHDCYLLHVDASSQVARTASSAVSESVKGCRDAMCSCGTGPE